MTDTSLVLIETASAIHLYPRTALLFEHLFFFKVGLALEVYSLSGH